MASTDNPYSRALRRLDSGRKLGSFAEAPTIKAHIVPAGLPRYSTADLYSTADPSPECSDFDAGKPSQTWFLLDHAGACYLVDAGGGYPSPGAGFGYARYIARIV